MFDGLFNGLLGQGKVQQSSDVQTQLEQRYIDALKRSSMGEAQYYQHMLEQERAQQNYQTQLGGSGGYAYTHGSGRLGGASDPWAHASRDIVTIKKSVYDELRHLHHWCKNTHPEVYEEWCAMRDLERVSKDEST